MGYTTTFKGELKFTKELTASQLSKIKSYLGEDCRKHPEWGTNGLTYIDLQLLDDFSGIRWDGSEKTYDLVDKVNLVIQLMKKEYPEFGLTGALMAQGEDIEDRWVLFMEDGEAVERETIIEGELVTCPDCGHRFILEKPTK
jgi:hypothetical protein